MKTLYNIIICSLIALTVSGCFGSRHTVSNTETKTDSVMVVERVTLDTIRIPGDSVKIRVPFQVLQTDTVIRYRNRTASATVSSKNGQLTFTAECDSLERLVRSYEKQLFKQTATASRSSEKEVKPSFVPGWLLWAGLILSALSIVWALIIYRKIKNIARHE